MDNLQYILSKQYELAKAYKEQEYKRKLEKNRAEKVRAKVKLRLNLGVN